MEDSNNTSTSQPDEEKKVLNFIEELVREDITFDETQRLYRNWAATYDQDVAKVQFNQPITGAEEIEKLYPHDKNIRILDCAAGTGLVGVELRKRGFTNLDALDACQDMLDKAKEKNIYHNIICDVMGPNRLQIEDDTYDAIVTTACFAAGHVGTDCFEELIRIVKPDGHIVAAIVEKFLYTIKEYRENMEPTVQRHQDNGLWKLITMKRIDNYYHTEPGMVYILKVLGNNH